jgi:hypothetical protein
MSLTSLERANRLIDYNRQRITQFRDSLSGAPQSGDTTLASRVLQQMEMSLKCLERQRDEMSVRLSQNSQPSI